MTRGVADANCVYVYADREPAVLVAARRGDASAREFRHERRRELSRSVIRDFVEFIGDSVLITYDASLLAELLSAPQILDHTRPILGRLFDLRDTALLAAPLAGDYTLAGLCRHLGFFIPDVIQQMPLLLAELEEALNARFTRLPDTVQGILRDILGDGGYAEDDPRRTLLPFSEQASRDLFTLARIGTVLPHRAKAAKRTSEAASGPIHTLAAEALAPGGVVASAHPAYEHRPGQVKMADVVARSLSGGEFLLVEAGTGVGKSLAYLIPAILWARDAGEPVVISTNTKNLQQQLMESDLPLLQRALPVTFEAAVLKGRSNYACVRSLAGLISDVRGSLFAAERLAVAHLFSWLAHSASGDIDELASEVGEVLPALESVLARVRSDSYACLGRACSYHSVCPVENARTRARNADVVVVNHALLLAETRSQILPNYSRVILDEAQNLETVATDCLSLEVSRFAVNSLRRAVYGESRSFLETLQRRLADMPEDRAGLDIIRAGVTAIPPLAEEAFGRLEDLGEYVMDLFAGPSSARGHDRATLRITFAVRESAAWKELQGAAQEALRGGRDLVQALKVLVEAIEECDLADLQPAEGLGAEAAGVMQRVNELLDMLEAIAGPGASAGGHVCWAETSQGRYGVDWSLRAAPVDIGAVLGETLYSGKEAVVFASATLAVDGGFRFFRQRNGLDPFAEKLTELSIPSDFHLPEQLLLCVPEDFPLPGEARFADAVVDAVAEIAAVTRGGTLVLFTSRARMKAAHRALAPRLAEIGLTLLAQDISGSRWALVERLRRDEGVVLLGLKSFWEGVDVPGSALRCVIIEKLPFAVPDDPITEARQEHVRTLGLDPIRDYYIPDAILGFKQGLGRLIRTATDRGVVFVLDRRILIRGYGPRFFRSIARCAFLRKGLAECLERSREWLGRMP
jgi:ATP-dependent DNA helicase DinG